MTEVTEVADPPVVEDPVSPSGPPAGPVPAAATPWWKEAVGVAATAAVCIAVMVPALRHGRSLGGYDWLNSNPLTHQPGVKIQSFFKSDQITQMIPWSSLAWTQVHHGHLPLWNPYNAMGMPLAFNWQSAVFSVPSLLGYLFPLNLAYTVQVLATLVIGGTGCYVCARVLGAGVVAAALGGSAFGLAGPFLNWVGWPIASVFSWTGWILTAVILVARGRHRIASGLLLAVVVAAAVYAGQPDALVVLGVAVAAFTVTYLIALRAAGSLPRPGLTVLDLGWGGLTGVGLSLPLLLPGMQLLGHSVRSQGGSALNAQLAWSWHSLVEILVLNMAQSPTFFPPAQYLGLIPVVLAVLAVIVRFRRPETIALGVTFVVMFLLVAVNPVTRLANALPGLHAVRFPRAIVLAVFVVAVLAALGADSLRRASAPAPTDRSAASRTATISVALFGIALLAVGGLAIRDVVTGPPWWVSALHRDILWSLGTMAAGLVASLLVLVSARGHGDQTPARSPWRGPAIGVAAIVLLIGMSTGLLLEWGTPTFASINGSPATAGTRELRAATGGSLVGLGSNGCNPGNAPGILVNANILFGVREFATYDPLVPTAYFTSWERLTGGQPGGIPQYSRFCPVVSTAGQARAYGMGYILEPAYGPRPTGTVLVKVIDGQGLYRVPGAAPVSLSGGSVRWAGIGTTRVTLHTRSSHRSSLVVRVTAAPGWHATVDGHPLALSTVDHIMLGADLPAGQHTVELTYWPTPFTVGLAGAGLALLAGLALVVVGLFRQRRSAATTRGSVPRGRG